MKKGLFITATGTDVGKTYVTGLIVKKMRESGLRAGYYKAALSGAQWKKGCLAPGDAEYVNQAAALGEKPEELVSYIYEHAVSPHLAAKLENRPVELETIREHFERVSKKYDYMAVEGSGGIICPLRYDGGQIIFLEDIIRELKLPVLVVAGAGLGTINSTVLTVDYLKSRNFTVSGIVFNHFHPGDIMEEDNRRMIEEMTGIGVCALVKENDTALDMEVGKLAELFA